MSRGSSEPSAGTPLRGQHRREKTHTAILDAAEQLLSERSADSIRIDDVAATAKVSPASVYLHFGTKDALISATLNRLLGAATAAFVAALTGVDEPLEQLHSVAAVYMRLLLEHPALIRYLSVNALGAAPALDDDAAISRQVEFLRGLLEKRIDDAIALGQIRDLDSRLLSYFMFGAWNGVAALALRADSSKLSIEQVERCLFQAQTIIAVGAKHI